MDSTVQETKTAAHKTWEEVSSAIITDVDQGRIKQIAHLVANTMRKPGGRDRNALRAADMLLTAMATKRFNDMLVAGTTTGRVTDV